LLTIVGEGKVKVRQTWIDALSWTHL